MATAPMKRPAATPAALTPLPVGAAFFVCAATLVVVETVDPPLVPVSVDVVKNSAEKQSVCAPDEAVGSSSHLRWSWWRRRC